MNRVLLPTENNLKYFEGTIIPNRKDIGIGSLTNYELRSDPSQSYVVRNVKLNKIVDRKTLLNELNELKKFNHKHIIQYYFNEITKKKEEEEIRIIMQKSKGSNLKEKIAKFKENNQSLPDYFIIKCLYEILLALEFLEKKQFTHRAFEISCVLLNENNEIMIGGLDSSILKERNLGNAKYRDYMYYMDPESIKNKKISSRTLLFGVGVIAYQLLKFQMPFEGENEDLLEKNISNNYSNIKNELSDSFLSNLILEWLNISNNDMKISYYVKKIEDSGIVKKKMIPIGNSGESCRSVIKINPEDIDILKNRPSPPLAPPRGRDAIRMANH